METLIRISTRLDRITTRVGKMAAWVALAMIVVTVFDVLTRNFSQSSWQALQDLVLHQQRLFGSTKLQELEWHLHTVLFSLCLGFAYVTDSHVRIDLIRDRLPPRFKWWLELVGVIFFLFPYCVLLIWFGTDFAITSYGQHEISSSATGLSHRWIIKAFIPLGMIFLFLAGAAVLLRKLVELFGTERQRRRVAGIEAEEEKHLDEVRPG